MPRSPPFLGANMLHERGVEPMLLGRHMYPSYCDARGFQPKEDLNVATHCKEDSRRQTVTPGLTHAEESLHAPWLMAHSAHTVMFRASFRSM
jgi:hypothetical protein